MEKREASEEPAEADPKKGVVYIGPTTWGFPVKKEKREAEEAPAKALATHPYGATSYVGQTVWGFPLE